MVIELVGESSVVLAYTLISNCATHFLTSQTKRHEADVSAGVTQTMTIAPPSVAATATNHARSTPFCRCCCCAEAAAISDTRKWSAFVTPAAHERARVCVHKGMMMIPSLAWGGCVCYDCHLCDAREMNGRT